MLRNSFYHNSNDLHQEQWNVSTHQKLKLYVWFRAMILFYQLQNQHLPGIGQFHLEVVKVTLLSLKSSQDRNRVQSPVCLSNEEN